MQRWIVRSGVAGAAFALALLGLEGGARLLFPLHEYREPGVFVHVNGKWLPTTGTAGARLLSEPEQLVEREFQWRYDLRWGHGRPYMDAEGNVTGRTNADGLRGPLVSRQKPEGVLRIAAVGDSFTFGHGVPDDAPWVFQLQPLLQAGLDGRGDARVVELVDFGVPGFTSKEVADTIEERALDYEPDLIVYALFLNDVFVTPAPRTADDAAGAVSRYHEVLYGERHGLARVSELARRWELARAARRYAVEYDYAQAYAPDSRDWRTCQDQIRRMKRLCQAAATPFYVVVFPDLIGLDGAYPWAAAHAEIRAFLGREEIASHDLYQDFKGSTPEALWVHPTDHHPNEVAHRLAAGAIATALAPLLPVPGQVDEEH